VQAVDDPPLRAALGDLVRLFGVEPEIYVGDSVPGGMVVLAHPRRIIVLDRGILAEGDGARRFVLGCAFDAIRAGYAQLLTLTRRERIELGTLLRSLLVPETERAAAAVEFVQSLPKRAAKGLERFVGAKLDVDSEAWIDAMLQGGKRGGLLACDDFGDAARMIARLANESAAVTQDGALALGALAGGADLVGFFLSDEYHLLRESLLNPMMAGTP
jgi:hypothetical protein